MPVIAKDLNLPSNAVGIINGILAFTGMFAKPLFGAIADKFRLHKFTFITFQIFTIIGFFSIQFLPSIEVDSGQVKLVCGAQTNFDVCFKESDRPCLIQNVLKKSFFNTTVKCTLTCDISHDLQTELCGPWKASPSICSEEITSEAAIPEYTYITKDDTKLKNSSNAVKYFSPSPGDDVKLHFIATVPLYHTIKVRFFSHSFGK